MGTLKPQSNGPLYSNMVIGTLAVDGWGVTFGTARRGLGALEALRNALYKFKTYLLTFTGRAQAPPCCTLN